MSTIILFGGAFNPVHTSHVALARAAVNAYHPQKLIVIPTAVSPHKSGCLPVLAEDRLNMCRQAFSDIPCAEVSDFELSSGGVSYSYITCEHFRALYPKSRILFLMGGDMLASFGSWKYPGRILASATLVAGARKGARDIKKSREEVEKTFGCDIDLLEYAADDVSSTRIRVLAALGEDFSAYVLPKTWQYINERGLYRNSLLCSAKTFENPSRWAHSVRVAVMCAAHAGRAHLSESDAVTMAALHDVSKNLPADSACLAGFVPPVGVPSPVMHQFSGAYVAEHTFGLKDEVLLNAIRYHTSGRAGMSEAEMLLYLCDMLEEGRDFKGVNKLRKIFQERSLAYAMYAALEHQINYLNEEGGDIYPLTKQAYLYYKELLT